jgi:hypothetical protein
MYDENGDVMSRQVYDPETGETRIYSGNSMAPEKPKEVADPGAAPNRDDFWEEPHKTDYARNLFLNPMDKRGYSKTFSEEKYNKAVEEWTNNKQNFDTYQLQQAAYPKQLEEWTAAKAQRDADKKVVADLRTTALGNLNELTPERQAQIEQFGTTFADSMHRDLDPRFDKTVRNEEERANATGMFGSRAYVDTKAELNKIKTGQDTDIANQSTMAKETLTSQDRQYWASLLNQIDSGQRADVLTTLQGNKTGADINAQNYAGTLGYYSAANNNKLAEWEAQRQRSAAYTQAGTGMGSGLLYLYGGMKSPSSNTGVGNTGTSFNMAPAKTSNGSFSLFG